MTCPIYVVSAWMQGMPKGLHPSWRVENKQFSYTGYSIFLKSRGA